MSIYDNLPGKVSLSGKVRTIEEDIYGVDEDQPSKIRPYELLVPLQDAVQNFVPGVYIPVTEKGQASGVATLDANGLVPAEQIPPNPDNYLPLEGGIMEGSIDMNAYDIENVSFIDNNILHTNQISSPNADIKIKKPLDMENNKIVDVAKGSTINDVATIANITDHDDSPFAHTDIRNLIAAFQGTYNYAGKINSPTASVTETALNSTLLAILERTALNGDVLVDNDNGEWRFNGTNWVNLGHFDITMATALNDGLMSKEDKAAHDALASEKSHYDLAYVHSTATGNQHQTKYIDLIDKPTNIADSGITNVYTKTEVDTAIEAAVDDIEDGTTVAAKATNDSLGNKIDTTYEKSANKVTTWQATPDDTHYPSEKLVDDRITPIEADVDDIEDGTTVVKKAEQDANGNNIANTYETKIASAQKHYKQHPSFFKIKHSAGRCNFSWSYSTDILWIFPKGTVLHSDGTTPIATSTATTIDVDLAKESYIYLMSAKWFGNYELKALNSPNIVKTDLSDLPPLTYTLDLYNSPLVTGSLSDLPPLTYKLNLYNCSLVTGTLSDLPPLTSYLDLCYCYHITGSLSDLPPLTYYLNLGYCSLITGSLSDLPPLTYKIDLGYCYHITGSLSDLPPLTYMLDLTNCSLVTGSLSDLSPLTYRLILYGCSLVTGVYSAVSGSNVPTTTVLTGTGLSTADMDATLIAYAATTKDNGTFTATGKTRSATSDTAVATLLSRGWTINGLTKV